MNWSYIAGVFDGEGYGNVHWHVEKQKYGTYGNWAPRIMISGEPWYLNELKKFIDQNLIRCAIYGTQLQIADWYSVSRFVALIREFTVRKRALIELMVQSVEVTVSKKRKEISKEVRDHMQSDLTKKMHSLSRKGKASIRTPY